jgi:GntR family transcriptional repressor for pyruvate dehydrogenase complex
MALKPVRRVRLSEHVAEQIMALVHDEGLQAGDPLPTETELMERMGVVRSSVREALRGLAVLGVVEIRQGQGTFVRSAAPRFGPDSVSTGLVGTALARGVTAELLEAREIIEVRMASLAARRATSEDLADLASLLSQAREIGGRGQKAFQLSAEFHLGVARAAHNDVLEGFVASYVHLLAERGALLQHLPGYHDWELREHDGIYQAIADHDGRLAKTRMQDHLKGMKIHFGHLAAASIGKIR